mmetsp:Transcript_17254/g.26923  ORF Transcript_17254/g.26923 Transcript_17254/m.26923 type:complete len:328 (-) Transcript_17254:54-1037(-)
MLFLAQATSSFIFSFQSIVSGSDQDTKSIHESQKPPTSSSSMKMMTYISVISIVVLQWALVTANTGNQAASTNGNRAASNTGNQAAEQTVIIEAKYHIDRWSTLRVIGQSSRTPLQKQQLKSDLDWLMECDKTVLDMACEDISQHGNQNKANLVAEIERDCRIQVARQTINRGVVLKQKQNRTTGEESELEDAWTSLMSCRMDELEEATRDLPPNGRSMVLKQRAAIEHAALTASSGSGTVHTDTVSEQEFDNAKTVMENMINHWKGLAGDANAQIVGDLGALLRNWEELDTHLKRAAYAQVRDEVSAEERELMAGIMKDFASTTAP